MPHENTDPVFDSHCHLELEPLFSDIKSVLDAAEARGVSEIVVPGVSRNDWSCVDQVVNLEHRVKRFRAKGLHPCFLDQHDDVQDLLDLEQCLSDDPSIVALGECGLDKYIEDQQWPRQLELFEAQLALAKRFDLPVIIHARRAVDDVIARLRRVQPGAGGVVHAFSGSVQQASQLFELGFSIGLGGAITYDRAQRLRKVAAAVPIDSILLETDAPDMPLAGYQGQPNHPEQVARVARVLAELRNDPIELIRAKTTENARRLFRV